MTCYRFALDRKCTQCSLSTGKAVTGQAQVPLSQAKLIIISSYPGKAEENMNMSLAPDTKRRSNGGQKPAGVFIRDCLRIIFDQCDAIPDEYKPFENYVYFTNAIKCKKADITVLEQHRRICKSQWLDKELLILPNHIPILLAGSDPVKSILGESETIWNNRNKELYYQHHPVGVCENPINIEKGLMFRLKHEYSDVFTDVSNIIKASLEDHQKEQLLNKVIQVNNIKPIFGMTTYFFKQDLENIRQKVIQCL